jgi:hypothetical protein
LNSTVLFLENGVSLDELVTRLEKFDYLIELIYEIRLFQRWEYKLYIKTNDLFIDIERVIHLKNQAGHAINAMIDFQKIEFERDKLIWFF